MVRGEDVAVPPMSEARSGKKPVVPPPPLVTSLQGFPAFRPGTKGEAEKIGA